MSRVGYALHAVAFAGLAAALFPFPVIAGDGSPDLVLDLGVGARVKSAYEGADTVMASPVPVVKFRYFALPNGTSFGGRESKSALSVTPAFNIVGERSDDIDSDLTGLVTIDTAIELGGRVSYRYDFLSGYGEVRRGFGGHEGVVGEVGVDAEFDPIPQLNVSVGPHATFADNEYMDTYFGVTPAEAAASTAALTAFDPDGGFKSVGVHGAARYKVRDNWFVDADASWERLIGDAADSPVVDVGNENVFEVGVGISRRFSLDLF